MVLRVIKAKRLLTEWSLQKEKSILDVKIEKKSKHANEVGSQNKNHTVSKSRHQERAKYFGRKEAIYGVTCHKKLRKGLKISLSFSSLF
jgi:hypothetical protein